MVPWRSSLRGKYIESGSINQGVYLVPSKRPHRTRQEIIGGGSEWINSVIQVRWCLCVSAVTRTVSCYRLLCCEFLCLHFPPLTVLLVLARTINEQHQRYVDDTLEPKHGNPLASIRQSNIYSLRVSLSMPPFKHTS